MPTGIGVDPLERLPRLLPRNSTLKACRAYIERMKEWHKWYRRIGLIFVDDEYKPFMKSYAKLIYDQRVNQAKHQIRSIKQYETLQSRSNAISVPIN